MKFKNRNEAEYWIFEVSLKKFQIPSSQAQSLVYEHFILYGFGLFLFNNHSYSQYQQVVTLYNWIK